MSKKIWDVTIGHNYSCQTVEAEDYQHAAEKTLILIRKDSPAIPESELWISKIEFIRAIR